MVFKMVTLDITQPYEDDFNPPQSPPHHTTILCWPPLKRRGKPKRRSHLRDEDFMEFVHHHSQYTRIFTIRALQVATHNFNNANLIGQGGSGKVYKGILANGYVVAVKRMNTQYTWGKKVQFQKEVKAGNISNHPNVARLLGICLSHDKLLLVYPFMVNLSLAHYLRERPQSLPPLNWQTRMSIALGAARGLLHLHSRNIIHRDIKAANILLDHNFVPLITDFGLAIFLDNKSCNNHIPPPPDHTTETVETAVRGTIGHIAPEYLSTGRCSKMNDVFGFGIMLFELITGQRAFDLARLANDDDDDDDDVMLLDWVKKHLKNGTHQLIIDQAMEGDYEESEVELLMIIALLCTHRDPRERPNMLQVIQFLQGSTRMNDEIVRNVVTDIFSNTLL